MTTRTRLEGHQDRRRRPIAAALLLLHLLLWVSLPFGDANAEARSARATAHVEGVGSQGCAPGHDHAACVVCRTLRAAGTARPSAQAVPVGVPGEHQPPTCRLAPAAADRVQPLHSRAPPSI